MRVLYVAVLGKETAAADRSGNTIKERESLLGGGSFIQNAQDADHLLTGRECAIFSFPEVDRSILRKVDQVDFRIIDGTAHGLGTEAVHQVEATSELASDEWQKLDKRLGRKTLLPDRESAVFALPPALAECSAQGLHLS